MTIADRIADLSMIWKQASMVFPYFDRCSIDWDETYKDHLSKVMNAQTPREFHLLLAEFMNLLGDGHTDYQFPRSLRNEIGYLPFTLRFMQDTYCIDATIPEYEAYLGQEILSINGQPFSAFLPKLKRYSYHVGNYISRYRLHQILPFLLRSHANIVETTNGSFSFDLLPYGNLFVSPKYTISSFENFFITSKNTVIPPTPESNIPIGLLSIFISTPI